MKEKPPSVIRAKELRKNMPDAERKFWRAVNYDKLGVKFRRQQKIGPYYVDFICFESKLAIELDGDQHAMAKDAEYDNRRTDFIRSQGYKIIRIPNIYVHKHLDFVIDHLKSIIRGEADANDYFKDRYDL